MLPVSIWIGGDCRDPEVVADYFAQVMRRLDAQPEQMRIAIESPHGVSLDMDPDDGAFLVRMEGGGVARRDFRRRWIADHDVPLPLSGRFRRRVVLIATPVDANRVRVRETFISRLVRRIFPA